MKKFLHCFKLLSIGLIITRCEIWFWFKKKYVNFAKIFKLFLSHSWKKFYFKLYLLFFRQKRLTDDVNEWIHLKRKRAILFFFFTDLLCNDWILAFNQLKHFCKNLSNLLSAESPVKDNCIGVKSICSNTKFSSESLITAMQKE